MYLLIALLILILFVALCVGLAALIDYNQWREDVIAHRIGRCRARCRPCADARERAANALYSQAGIPLPPGPPWRRD